MCLRNGIMSLKMKSKCRGIFFLFLIKINKCSFFRLVGLFEFRRPVVLLRDPQLIKQLAVKDFDHFMDHRVLMTEELDPLFGKNLVSLSGHKWRDMRSTLSPAFTGKLAILLIKLTKYNFFPQNSQEVKCVKCLS